MRRCFVPEVVQTSAMDCGPASLTSLLEGHGISASYGRIREACHTDVDGTSVDRLEEAATALGLNAEQVMVPVDHVFSPSAQNLPALAVVQIPGGDTHFIVLWRRYGSLVQVMDPAEGRRWISVAEITAQLYRHRYSVPAEDWSAWARSGSFLQPLENRMKAVGVGKKLRDELLQQALDDDDTETLRRLDAAVRMIETLVRSGGISAGRMAAELIKRVTAGGLPIAPEYWSAVPDSDQPGNLVNVGAVLLTVRGTKERSEKLSTELAAAINEPPKRVGRDLLKLLLQDGFASPAILLLGLLFAAAGVATEGLIFRALLDIGQDLKLSGQRGALAVVVLSVVSLFLILDLLIARSTLRLGRHLELRLRIAFLSKLPRLGDRYLHSRPIADMAERSHRIHHLRTLPDLGFHLLRNVMEVALILAGIGWFYPSALSQAILVSFVALAIPLAAQPLLNELDLRQRGHFGAMMRFYLDGLIGRVAVQAHCAERTIRREHEKLQAEWAAAGFKLQRVALGVEGLHSSVAVLLTVWLISKQLSFQADLGSTLLLVYWTLSAMVLSQEIAALTRQFPAHRNLAQRIAEPLGAPEDRGAFEPSSVIDGAGITIALEGVTVRAAGHVILDEVSLTLAAGEHVAIVGPSGAGKSSLVGLLLGWHTPAEGLLLVDGEPLQGERLEYLRGRTTWIEPEVYLWNQSVDENLRYGSKADLLPELDQILEQAELRSMLKHLPEGLQTTLGEAGGKLSGGEGQRVRIGRAMARRDVQLAILDEPARGLDRRQRRLMIERARHRWKEATLLCVTHDVSDTRKFDRVLVIEGGRIAEDGPPAVLASNPKSRYRELLESEQRVQLGLWSSPDWRRLRMQEGALAEEGAISRAQRAS